jgi:hypothetical protein
MHWQSKSKKEKIKERPNCGKQRIKTTDVTITRTPV